MGKEGGILNAILGSLALAFGATLLACIFALPMALYLNTYAAKGRLTDVPARSSLDVLWGVPSIVYGAVGFTVMLILGMPASLLAGILVIALVEMPILVRGIDEVMKLIPHELSESALALGATRTEVAFGVVLRQALPGIVTAVLLAFGRGSATPRLSYLSPATPTGCPRPCSGRSPRSRWPCSSSWERLFPRFSSAATHPRWC